MALTITTGYTDDGLVFMRMEGQQEQDGRPVETVVTLEPDYAEGIAHKMLDAAKKAQFACKRPLVLGKEITIPRR
jgi:hypothetical protein